MALVSIIIPVYNSESYLEKCLESVIKQSLTDIEIIIINDGSTDNSIDLIEKYAKSDERIIVIDKQNGGQSSARNSGLFKATGEYISFIDSDDCVDENMIRDMYELCKNNQSDIAICDYNMIFESDLHSNKHNVFKLDNEIIDISDISGFEYIKKYMRTYKHGNEVCTRMYRNSLLKEKNILFDKNSKSGVPEIGEDMFFNFKVAIYANKIVSCKNAYYNYFIHNGSAMTSYKPNLLTRMVTLLEKFYCHLIEEKVESKNNIDLFIKDLFVSILKEEYVRYKRENRIKEFTKELNELQNNNFVTNQKKIKCSNSKDNLIYKLICKKYYFILDTLEQVKKKIS